MYRLANIVDSQLQKIITKELIHGFEETCNLTATDANDIIAQMEVFFDQANIHIDSKIQHDFLVYKIIGMYQELRDTTAEYTFDEQGEYLLAKMLEYQLTQYELFLESVLEQEGSDEDSDIEPDITDFWTTSLTTIEQEYVDVYASNFFKKLRKDAADEEDVDSNWYDEMEALFIERVTNFPLMTYEFTDEVTPEFLFWDTDFLLIEKFGMENFEMIKDIIANRGSDLGFSGVDENTQLYTGSSKFELPSN